MAVFFFFLARVVITTFVDGSSVVSMKRSHSNQLGDTVQYGWSPDLSRDVLAAISFLALYLKTSFIGKQGDNFMRKRKTEYLLQKMHTVLSH